MEIDTDFDAEPKTLTRTPFENDEDTVCFEEKVNYQHIHGAPQPEFKTPPRNFQGAVWRTLVRRHTNIHHFARTPVSCFVGVVNCDALPEGWCRKLMYQFVLVNHLDESKNILSQRLDFVFDKKAAPKGCTFLDQGLAECFLINPSILANPESGYLDENGDMTIRIMLDKVLEKTRPPLNNDPKKMTGMVGLENLGATCYLNALLQMLFHITKFRKSVYLLPIQEGVAVDASTTLALQSVFHNLQVKEHEVNTRELTKAFGWTSADAFLQQDVQEMMRVLLDKLEEKMVGTVVEGAIKDLFAGKCRSFIRCVNVDYESARDEDFYDIQLDIKGCKNVRESFLKYTEKEMLNEDNKYDAGQHGKQDAEKGVTFMKFPPVLTMHLKRFAFDFNRMGFTKVHDRYEFPVVLDLNEFVDPDAEPEVKAINHVYELQSVLVHSGDVHGGHYYAYIRPAGKHNYGENVWNPETNAPTPGSDKAGKWYIFNDDQVYEVQKHDAVDLCFGTKPNGLTYEKFSSAYMLVYVRVDAGPTIMAPSANAEDDIPEALSIRLDGMKQKEMMERRSVLIDEAFTDMYYWIESDVAYFSQYQEAQLTGDFLSPKNKRKVIVPKHSTYLAVYMTLLQEYKLKPWQLFIYPFNHNADNATHQQLALAQKKTLTYPIKCLDDVEWFYNKFGNCKMLNACPDNSYFYVHITDQFDTCSDFDRDLVDREYTELLRAQASLQARIAQACSETKGAFVDEALNMKPFNYSYGCVFGASLWSLHLLKNKPKALMEEFVTTQKDFCFNSVLVHIMKAVGQRKLMFFKAYDPLNKLPMVWKPQPTAIINEDMIIYGGKVLKDYNGEYVSEDHFNDDLEDKPAVAADAAGGDASAAAPAPAQSNAPPPSRKTLLERKALRKHQKLISDYRDGSCKVRYLGCFSVDPARKMDVMVPLCVMYIKKNYSAYKKFLELLRDNDTFTPEQKEAIYQEATIQTPNMLPYQQQLRQMTPEAVDAVLTNYWHKELTTLYSLTLPVGHCIGCPNPEYISVRPVLTTDAPDAPRVRMSDLTLSEFFGLNYNTSNIVYCEHFSETAMASVYNKPIISIEGYKLEDITLHTYLTYYYHVRTIAVRPDENGMREILAILAKESLSNSKKKRSRATLTREEGGAGAADDEDDEDDEELATSDSTPVAAPADGEMAVVASTSLGPIAEDAPGAAPAPAADGSAAAPTAEAAVEVVDPLIRQYSAENIEINTSISAKMMIETLAEKISPEGGGTVDPHRIMIVAANSRVNGNGNANALHNVYHNGGVGAFLSNVSIALPPILPTACSIATELSDRKFTRKMDHFIYRLTPYNTTLSINSNDMINLLNHPKVTTFKDAGEEKIVSLFDVGKKQFELIIADHRMISIRKHFLSLYRTYAKQQHGGAASPATVGGEPDADEVSRMMKSSCNTTPVAEDSAAFNSKRQKAGALGASQYATGTNSASSSSVSGQTSVLELTEFEVETTVTTTTMPDTVEGADAEGGSATPASPSMVQAERNSGEKVYSSTYDNITLDTHYLEDLYGLLWPCSSAAALSKEFVSPNRIYVIDDRKSGTVTTLSRAARNAAGIPIRPSNNSSLSNVRRLSSKAGAGNGTDGSGGSSSNNTPAGAGSVVKSRTDSDGGEMDLAENSTTTTEHDVKQASANGNTVTTVTEVKTTATRTTAVVQTPYVSSSTQRDHKWLNSITHNWLDAWCSSHAMHEAALPPAMQQAQAPAAIGPHAEDSEESTASESNKEIVRSINKLSYFLKCTKLLCFKFEERGSIVNFYFNSCKFDSLGKCWLDVPTSTGYQMELAAATALSSAYAATSANRHIHNYPGVKQHEYGSSNLNLIIQFVSPMEEQLLLSAHPSIKSIGAYVYYFQPLTYPAPAEGQPSYHPKWTHLDVDVYGVPMLTYITELDTVETLSNRVAGVAGIPTQEAKLAYLRNVDDLPIYLPTIGASGTVSMSSTAPSPVPGADGSVASTDALSNNAGTLQNIASGAETHLEGETVYQFLKRVYPNVVAPKHVREKKMAEWRNQSYASMHANAHKPVGSYPPPAPDKSLGSMPVLFPLIIGIERATIVPTATTHSVTSHKVTADIGHRFRKVPSSIKIN